MHGEGGFASRSAELDIGRKVQPEHGECSSAGSVLGWAEERWLRLAAGIGLATMVLGAGVSLATDTAYQGRYGVFALVPVVLAAAANRVPVLRRLYRARASVVRAPGASPIVARCATRDYDADDAGVRARRARKKNASKREWRRFSLTRMRTVLAGACVVGKTRAEGARAA